MAEKNRHVEIVPTGDGNFEFREGSYDTGSTLVFNKDREWVHGRKMKRSDKFRIFFYLPEEGSYKFDTRKGECVLSVGGQPCPYPNHGNREIEVDDVEDYRVEVINRDSGRNEFKFSIHMLADGTPLEWDPIMSNRNGGT